MGENFTARLTRRKGVVIAALGTSQTLAWACSYYLTAILADPISRSLGLPRSWFFTAFSLSLVIVAACGPRVGRIIDRRGGRAMLTASNFVFAAGLLLLASVRGPVTLFAAWAVLGIGMAMGLYDAGFATLATIYGRNAGSAITGITLYAGFASTVGWPLTSYLSHTIGWRETCVVWAVLNLVIGAPLNRFLLPNPEHLQHLSPSHEASVGWKPYKEMILLAYVFTASWFVTGAMGAHLPRLLERTGATPFQAIAAAALVGPAQVGARVVEFFFMRRIHPLISARLASVAHPVGAAILMLAGPAGASAFASLYGAGNGLLTIARGTVPLAIFGPRGYGERMGLLNAPARALQAFAPLLFGLLMDRLGARAVLVSAGLCLSALGGLLFLRTSYKAPALDEERAAEELPLNTQKPAQD